MCDTILRCLHTSATAILSGTVVINKKCDERGLKLHQSQRMYKPDRDFMVMN